MRLLPLVLLLGCEPGVDRVWGQVRDGGVGTGEATVLVDGLEVVPDDQGRFEALVGEADVHVVHALADGRWATVTRCGDDALLELPRPEPAGVALLDVRVVRLKGTGPVQLVWAGLLPDGTQVSRRVVIPVREQGPDPGGLDWAAAVSLTLPEVESWLLVLGEVDDGRLVRFGSLEGGLLADGYHLSLQASVGTEELAEIRWNGVAPDGAEVVLVAQRLARAGVQVDVPGWAGSGGSVVAVPVVDADPFTVGLTATFNPSEGCRSRSVAVDLPSVPVGSLVRSPELPNPPELRMSGSLVEPRVQWTIVPSTADEALVRVSHGGGVWEIRPDLACPLDEVVAPDPSVAAERGNPSAELTFTWGETRGSCVADWPG